MANRARNSFTFQTVVPGGAFLNPELVVSSLLVRIRFFFRVLAADPPIFAILGCCKVTIMAELSVVNCSFWTKVAQGTWFHIVIGK